MLGFIGFYRSTLKWAVQTILVYTFWKMLLAILVFILIQFYILNEYYTIYINSAQLQFLLEMVLLFE